VPDVQIDPRERSARRGRRGPTRGRGSPRAACSRSCHPTRPRLSRGGTRGPRHPRRTPRPPRQRPTRVRLDRCRRRRGRQARRLHYPRSLPAVRLASLPAHRPSLTRDGARLRRCSRRSPRSPGTRPRSHPPLRRPARRRRRRSGPRGRAGHRPRREDRVPAPPTFPPPEPNISWKPPQSGHRKPAMFSAILSTFVSCLPNIRRPFTASSSATSCGVVTIGGARQRERLEDRELGVAGPRRQVHYEVVELPPPRPRRAG